MPTDTTSIRTSHATIALAAGLVLVAWFLGTAAYGAVVNHSAVPFWDMWDGFLGFYVKSLTDPTAWWAQHNEHRIVLARLLFWVDVRVFGGDGAFLIAANFLLALALFLVAGAVTVHKLPIDAWAKGLIVALVTALAFAWFQQNNLTWGFQSQFYLAQLLPLLSLASLMFAHAVGLRGWIPVLASLAFGVAAAGSMANGVLTLFLAAFAARQGGLGVAKVVVLLCAAIAIAALYFRGYTSPGGHGSITESLLTQPWDVATYFFAYAGSPFAYLAKTPGTGVNLATGVGMLISGAAVALGSRAIFRRPSGEVGGSLVLGVFVLYLGISAVAIAGSRVGFGLESAVASRYTTPALLLLICALGLASRWMLQSRRGRPVMFLIGALFIVAAAFAPVQRAALADPGPVDFEKSVAALALELGIEDQAQVIWIFPSAEWGIRIADEATAVDFSIFADPRIEGARELIGSPIDIAPGTVACDATVGEQTALPGGTSRVHGAIVLPGGPTKDERLLVAHDGTVVGVGIAARSATASAGDGPVQVPYKAYMADMQAGGEVSIFSPASGCRGSVSLPPHSQD